MLSSDTRDGSDHVRVVRYSFPEMPPYFWHGRVMKRQLVCSRNLERWFRVCSLFWGYLYSLLFPLLSLFPPLSPSLSEFSLSLSLTSALLLPLNHVFCVSSPLTHAILIISLFPSLPPSPLPSPSPSSTSLFPQPFLPGKLICQSRKETAAPPPPQGMTTCVGQQHLRCQYLCFCTSKASTFVLSTLRRAWPRRRRRGSS